MYPYRSQRMGKSLYNALYSCGYLWSTPNCPLTSGVSNKWPSFIPYIIGDHQQPLERVTFSPSQKRGRKELPAIHVFPWHWVLGETFTRKKTWVMIQKMSWISWTRTKEERKKSLQKNVALPSQHPFYCKTLFLETSYFVKCHGLI